MPFDAGSNHNFLSDCAERVREGLKYGEMATRESLRHYRDVGQALLDAKEALAGKKGAFGEWCEAEGFTMHKTWRAKLMKLAENWDAIMEVVDTTPDADRKVTLSVEGVLNMWAAYVKSTDPEAQAKAEAKKAEREAKKAKDTEGEGEEGESETAALRRMLREAMERIAALEAELAKAKAGPKASEGPKAESPKASRKTVDEPTKARARKVWRLYKAPGTEGEGAAAKQRLEAMASGCGMTFEEFVAACGLN